MNEWDDVQWFKSTDSGDHGCVEVGYHLGKIWVRDTKDRAKPPHVYTRDEWTAFLAGAKRGEFDLPR